MKIISYLSAFIFFLALALFTVSANSFFYEYQFEKNGTYQVVDIEREDMPVVIKHLGDYLVGLEDDFNHQLMIKGELTDVYGQREIDHMADVRRLFDYIKYAALISFVLLLINLYRLSNRAGLKYLQNWLNAALIGIIVLLISLFMLAQIDFTAAFIKFHQIFFSNDLWILNPKTDRLIQMLPEVFFKEAAILIVVLALIYVFLGKAISVFLKRYSYFAREGSDNVKD